MSKIKNLQIFRRHLGRKRKTFHLEEAQGRVTAPFHLSRRRQPHFKGDGHSVRDAVTTSPTRRAHAPRRHCLGHGTSWAHADKHLTTTRPGAMLQPPEGHGSTWSPARAGDLLPREQHWNGSPGPGSGPDTPPSAVPTNASPNRFSLGMVPFRSPGSGLKN